MKSALLTIRPALPGDAAALQYVGAESYREHFSDIWTVAGIEAFLAADFSDQALQVTLAAPQRHLWLLACENDERPVGYAKINWGTSDPIVGRQGAEVHKIYLLKSCVGKGYGRALWTYILDCVSERSLSRIWLDVLKSNTTARRFYERNGLRVLGELPFGTDRAQIGMLVMARDLSA